MKNIFAIFIVLFTISLDLAAQTNNLQYNRSIYLQLNCTNGSAGCILDSTITISPGKVWKLESSTAEVYGNTRINGIVIGQYAGMAQTGFPIWLPAGSYTFTVATGVSDSIKGFFSGIEFNEVP